MRENIIDEILEVVQAFKDGEIIECIPIHVKYQKFHIVTTPQWDFKNFFYRIKAKPLEVWANILQGGHVYYHTSELVAQERGLGAVRIAVHMKEVE